MGFKVKHIENLCWKITDGSHFSPENDTEGIYPMYSVKDMDYNGFALDGYKTIGKEVFEKLCKADCRPLKNDVLIAKDGSYLKYVFKAKQTLNACILSSIAILRPDIKVIDPDYFVYILRTKSVKNAMANYVSGSALPRIILSDFKKMKVRIEENVDTQRRIASILSAYDNLIENNNRRIRLLEQMAENLYKEWFVRFRFPGHEKAEFENGLPMGWKVMKLDKILTVRYGKDHSKIEDGDIPILGSGGIMRFGNKELYASESVLIPRKGSLNNIMYIDEPFWTVDTMFFTEMKYKNIAKYVYYVLSGIDMESFNSGAALPSMTTNILNHFKVILPSEDVLALFDEKVELLFLQKKKLIQQNTLLSRQRDLLLPRLMSGKLEVKV